MKAKVLDLFMQIDKKSRIVIATMGYSMGVDCPDMYRVPYTTVLLAV